MRLSRGGRGCGVGCGSCNRDQAINCRVDIASSGNCGADFGSCPKARGVIANKKPANKFVVRFMVHLFRKTKRAGEPIRIQRHYGRFAGSLLTWWRTAGYLIKDFYSSEALWSIKRSL